MEVALPTLICSNCTKPRINNKFGQCKECKRLSQKKYMDQRVKTYTEIELKLQRRKKLDEELMARMELIKQSL